MNKLQLYITMSQSTSGFQTMVEVNPEAYAKGWICDLRSVVSQVDYPANEKAIFYMAKYIDEGMFITVLRTIPKVHGNHLAAWIFIPYSIRISDKEIRNVVEMITSKVSASEVKPKDIAEMRSLFDRTYEEDMRAPIFAPSEGFSYAYRYYGPRTGVTFNDLIGPFRFQACYLPFAGVLLVDQDITSDIAGTNLTSAPLDDMAVVFPPPQAQDLGFKPLIYGQPFDMPYYVPMSRNVDIIWHKDHYEDIKQTIYVAQSEMRAPSLQQTHPSIVNTRLQQQQQQQQRQAAPTPQEPVQTQGFSSDGGICIEPQTPTPAPVPAHASSPTPEAPAQPEWHQRFQPQHKEQQPKEQPRPKEQPQTDQPAPRPQQAINFEAAPEPAQQVPIETPRFGHSHAQHHNHAHTDLPQRKNVYRFQVPTRSAEMGSMIEFDITTAGDITESPIEGYEATGTILEGTGRINHLIYKGEDSRKKLVTNAIYAAAGFLVGLIIALLCTCGSSNSDTAAAPNDSVQATQINQPVSDATSSSSTPTEATTATPAAAADAATAPAPEVSLKAAINYLDTNKTWERSQMEAFPDLRGLYDDMNNINRQRIVEVWGPKLKESRTFTNLVVHHSKISMKKKAKRTPYNGDGDTRINVQSYLNTIDP